MSPIYFSKKDKLEICRKINEVLTSGQLTLGKYNSLFEEQFAQYLNVRYAIAVNSGTSSLEIILRCLGVEDNEVIVPTNTFFATPASVIHAGGIVRFADIDKNTFSLSLVTVRKQLNKKTKGVIIVHIGGIISPEIEEIKKFCQENRLFLIEDAAHAHGSQYNGRYAGTFGEAASFSFYPTKVITSAEGGMIVTNNKKIYEEAKIYRDQGKVSFTQNLHTRLGYNWRMSEPHAIIGLTQLKHIKEFIKARQSIAHIYDEGLANLSEVAPLSVPPNCISNFYKYIVILKGLNRDKLKKVLKEKFNVGLSGEVYETPCHLQPIFKKYKKEKLCEAEDVCCNHICLPISANMRESDAVKIISALKKAISYDKKHEG